MAAKLSDFFMIMIKYGYHCEYLTQKENCNKRVNLFYF